MVATDRRPAPIALFLPTLDDGGAERVMLQLAQCFSARGHAVDLVIGIPGGPLDSQIPAGPRVVELGAARTTRALAPLVRYLRRERPRALLSTLEHSNILSVWARFIALTGTRLVLREANVLTPRSEMHGLRPHVLQGLMRAFYRHASAVIAVSHAVAQSMIDGLGLPRRLVSTIYNPVITPSLAAKAALPLDDPWFAPGAPPVVMGVGRLVPAKDFPTLVRAFAEVRARRPARLLILGEGADRRALEELVRGLGLESDVRLPGFDHNPFRFMKRSTVFALSSLYEGLPNSLIQAMACGCRVISTDCPGGSREILEAGSGQLVPMRDPPALARSILAGLEDADRDPARVQHPVERFTEQATIDQYLAVLGVR